MTEKCTTCARHPERINNDIAECSHVECPHRGRAWSDRPAAHTRTEPAPEPICAIARENGGDVPMACLFECSRGCHRVLQRAAPARPLRVASPDDFDEVAG